MYMQIILHKNLRKLKKFMNYNSFALLENA